MKLTGSFMGKPFEAQFENETQCFLLLIKLKTFLDVVTFDCDQNCRHKVDCHFYPEKFGYRQNEITFKQV